MSFYIRFIGFLLVFMGFLVGVYDGIMSYTFGKNLFLSIFKVIDYFKPNYINSYRFGLRENDSLWVDWLQPSFEFPVCLLLIVFGLVIVSSIRKDSVI